MSKDLTTIVEERLPQHWEIEKAIGDLRLTREAFQELVESRSYSSTHPKGPLEISIDLDAFSENLLEANAHLSVMSESLDNIETNTANTATGVWVSVEQRKVTNAFLQAIRHDTEELSGIHEKLRHIEKIDFANLGFTTLSLAVQYHTGKTLELMNDNIRDLVDGQNEIIESIDTLGSVVEEGFEQLGEIMEEGFEHVVDGLNDIKKGLVHQYLEQKRDAIKIQQQLDNADANQERRHKENIADRQFLFRNRASLQADEYFSFAHDQFLAGNTKKSLKELEKAFHEKSTHIPSMLLLGDILVQQGQWPEAKDTFYSVSKLAQQQEDVTSYDSAILALAKIEKSVGNWEQAKKLLEDSLERKHSSSFTQIIKEYLRMHDVDLEKDRLAEKELHLPESILHTLKSNYDLWNEIVTEGIGASFRRRIVALDNPYYAIVDIGHSSSEFDLRTPFTEVYYGRFKKLLIEPLVDLFDAEYVDAQGKCCRNPDFKLELFTLAKTLDQICDPQEGRALRENSTLMDMINETGLVLYQFNEIVKLYNQRSGSKKKKNRGVYSMALFETYRPDILLRIVNQGSNNQKIVFKEIPSIVIQQFPAGVPKCTLDTFAIYKKAISNHYKALTGGDPDLVIDHSKYKQRLQYYEKREEYFKAAQFAWKYGKVKDAVENYENTAKKSLEAPKDSVYDSGYHRFVGDEPESSNYPYHSRGYSGPHLFWEALSNTEWLSARGILNSNFGYTTMKEFAKNMKNNDPEQWFWHAIAAASTGGLKDETHRLFELMQSYIKFHNAYFPKRQERDKSLFIYKDGSMKEGDNKYNHIIAEVTKSLGPMEFKHLLED